MPDDTPTIDRQPTDPDDLFNEAVLAFQAERAAGAEPDLEPFAARYPEVEARLREFLADQSRLPTERAERLPSFDRYEVDAPPLNRGGMGVIFRARDRALNREVALKTLRARHADSDHLRRRFVEEAQIASQLQHPNIVPVHELGELPDGRPYFAMKLIRGRDLAALLKERPSPGHDLPRFVTVFQHICQAVAYAHTRQVLHRDLKPQNVMVGAFGEVQVMDWGLGKAVGGPGADGEAVATLRSLDPEAEQLTGGALGTFAYMAPEQARGEIDRVGPPSDVFGLGAILCVILTGQPPYVSEDRAEVPAKAESADLADCHARLAACGADAGLVEIATRCLAADPAARPAWADEVAAAVAAYQEGVQKRLQAAEVSQARAETRAAEERKRHRMRLGLATSVMLLVSGATAGGAWYKFDRDKRAIEEQARLEKQQQVEREREATARDGLAEWDRWTRQGKFPAAREALQRVEGRLAEGGPEELQERARQARRELDMEARLKAIRERGSLVTRGTRFQERSARDEYARAFADFGLDPATPTRWALQIRSSPIRGSLLIALDTWAFDESDPAKSQAILRLAREVDPDSAWRAAYFDPEVRKKPQAIGRLIDSAPLDRLGPTELLSLAQGATFLGGDSLGLLRHAARRFPSDFWVRYSLSQALSWESYRLRRLGKEVGPVHSEAFAHAQAAVALDPDSAAAHTTLGQLMTEMRLDESLAEFQEAIRLDPDFPIPYCFIVEALRSQRRHEEADARAEEAWRRFPRHGLVNAFWAGTQVRKGDKRAAIRPAVLAACELTKLSEPRDLLQSLLTGPKERVIAEQVCREELERDPSRIAAVSACRAIILKSDFRLTEMEQISRQVLQHLHEDPAALTNMGLVHSEFGRQQEAEQSCRAALEQDANIGAAHGYLGLIAMRQGRFEDARQAFRKSAGTPEFPNQWVGLITYYIDSLDKIDRTMLPDFISGKAVDPFGSARMAAAELCLIRGHTVASVRNYERALSGFTLGSSPSVFLTSHQTSAARAAVLAASGRGTDADKLTEAERARFLGLARKWLRADLKDLSRQATRKGDLSQVRRTLEIWRNHIDLAGVREPDGLAKLPEEERRLWGEFWADVDQLYRQVDQLQRPAVAQGPRPENFPSAG